MWMGSNGQNTVTSYVATEPIEVWTFDVMDFVDHTDSIASLPVNQSWYLTSIQAGFEPWQGGVGLAVESFDAKVTTNT
ncbi:hypothetical protein BV508_30755 [Mycobacterium intermedium]|nr:hypothetical protein BV508_30755 [Mycobacterium intermedium]